MAYKSMAEMGHSPNEMGHSPAENQNKGYAKQEKKDLMNDNPVARDASGGRPWIARHFKSTMGSPAKMNYSPMEMAKPDYIDIDGDGDKKESMKKAAKQAGKAGGKVGTAMPKK
jgi:hypothetical protein